MIIRTKMRAEVYPEVLTRKCTKAEHAVAIQAELQIPVKYIGVGEKIDDLRKFDSAEFVDALFTRPEEEE